MMTQQGKENDFALTHRHLFANTLSLIDRNSDDPTSQVPVQMETVRPVIARQATFNEIKIADIKLLIEDLKNIVENTDFMSPATVPHFTVLACLTGLALWGALGNDGLGLIANPLFTIMLATTVGLTSGIWSLATRYNNWNFSKNATLTKLQAISDKLSEVSAQNQEQITATTIVTIDNVHILLKNSLKEIKGLALNCSQSHNTMFASATGGLTTLAYTSLYEAYLRDNHPLLGVLTVFGVIAAITAAGCSIKLGNNGQLNLALMNKINNATNSAHLLTCGGTVASGLRTRSATRGVGFFDQHAQVIDLAAELGSNDSNQARDGLNAGTSLLPGYQP